MLLLAPVYAAQIVNVEYIHNAIAQKWDITVPYNSALSDPRVAANMKYLLTTIDVANEMLNGESTTEYGNGEYATLVAADTIATNNAVEQLIKQSIVYPFTATTAIDTTEFKFRISSAGEFYIDWGDGSTEVVTKTDASTQELSHNYDTAGMYKIKLAGKATGYNSTDLWGAISFSSETDLVAIDGCLGCIFSTLSDNTQPRFRATFSGTSITSIPEGLFAGLHGEFTSGMFELAFAGTKITSIPANLFHNLVMSSYGASGVFSSAFEDTPITSIPENLFAKVTYAGTRMFDSTFSGTQIREIPAGLFSSLRGARGYAPFVATFADTPITSIPENLFAGIEMGAYSTFSLTFAGTKITSIPSKLFANITWNDEYPEETFASTFAGTKITSIPEGLFNSFLQNDYYMAPWVFSGTFDNCERLERLPDNLFAGLRWAGLVDGVAYIFAGTFSNCTSLKEIPYNLFGADVMYNFAEGDEWMYEGAFAGTFAGCSSLTGPSARIKGEYFYEKWPTVPPEIFYDMYFGCEGLSDYNCIPSEWGGGGKNCLWTDPA